MNEITISPKIFNPLYWHIKEAFEDENLFIILITGGSSASKTFSLAQYFLFESMQRQVNTMILRKEGVSIADSIYSDFKTIGTKINKSLGIQHNNYFVNKVISGTSRFRFRGLDDSEKIKGLSDYQYVWLNEVSSFEHAEYSEIKRRLRGRPGQKVIADWNPIDENHWLKTEIFDKEDWIEQPLSCKCPVGALSQLDAEFSQKFKSKDGKVLFIKTTYRDNYWCVGHSDGVHGYKDENALYNFEQMRIKEPSYYQIYGLGNWGKLNVGGEFYKKFKAEVNCKEISYNPLLPIHLSFDFNVNPGMHATVWQIEGKKAWQINEIVTKAPKNTTMGVCDEFKRLYPNHTGGLFVYGDPSGKNKDTRQEKGSNDYTIINRELAQYKPSQRVALAHPSPKMRGNFINSIFESCIYGVEIWINPKCNNTLQDLMYGKEDSDGSKLKEKIKDPQTKVLYEKYHHCSDSMDYFICEAFKSEYEKYQGVVKIKPGSVVQIDRKPKYTL